MTMRYQDRSFYLLEVFVRPGGAREAMVFVSSKIDEIQTALYYSLDYPDAIYLTVWYGRDISLATYQEGIRTGYISLLPYITIHIPGLPAIWFDEQNSLRGISFSDRLVKRDPEAELEMDSEDFIELVLSDAFDFRFTVDWEAVPTEALSGMLAMPGQAVQIETSYTGETLFVPYGYSEFEDGLSSLPGFDWETDIEP
jgi:hypothetical protein